LHDELNGLQTDYRIALRIITIKKRWPANAWKI